MTDDNVLVKLAEIRGEVKGINGGMESLAASVAKLDEKLDHTLKNQSSINMGVEVLKRDVGYHDDRLNKIESNLGWVNKTVITAVLTMILAASGIGATALMSKPASVKMEQQTK